MIRNRLGLPARFLMVATAVACWIPCVPAAAAGMPLVQTPPPAPTNLNADLEGASVRLTWTASTPLPTESPVTGYRIRMYYRPDLQDWTDLVPNTRNTDLTYLHTAPPRGTTVHYQVAAINAAGTVGGPSNNAMVVTPTGTGTTGAEPGNLRAIAGPTTITLSWNRPTVTGGNTITGYQVEESANGSPPWTLLTPTPTNVTVYQRVGLPAGVTRYYRVRAVYVNLVSYGPWAYAQATTATTRTPGAPRNLSATAAGPTVIDLDWDAPASNGGSAITSYQIHVLASDGSWSLLGTTLASMTEYSDATAAVGVTRRYRVRAVNASGPGEPAFVNATAEAGTPGPPRDLTASADGASVIELDWRAPSDAGSAAVTGYWIEWSANGVIWDVLERNHRATGYRDEGLSPGTTRHYRVAAINRHGQGDWSEEVQATTSRPPGRPTGLTARAQGTSRIELDWTAPTGGGPVTGYWIEWSSTGTGGWTRRVRNSRATSYTDTGLSAGTTRHYRVAAINAAGEGPWSRVVQATTEVTVPGAPTSLTVVPNGLGGSTELRLNWRAPSNTGGSPITGYSIQWSPSAGGPWRFLVPGPTGTATTYVDKGLPPNTTRYYRVRAVNAQGQGNPSTAVRGTTDAARPDRPRNLRTPGAGPDSIILNWDAPASNGGTPITGYTIRRSGSKDGPWMPIVPNTGSTATTYTNTGLQPATLYWYQVAAINRVGTGDWSFEFGTTTHPEAPDAPTGLTARPVGTARIDLSWSAPRDTGGAPILGYRIEASDDGGRNWNIIVRRNTSSRGTTFSDVNLQPATTRHYRVAALNTAGTGPFSNTARATTEATVPGTPRSLDAEADGTSRIELSWREPTSNGGSRITGYRIEVSEDGGTRWDDLVANTRNTRTTYAHTGLEPATRRHYRVSAINREGVGRASRAASAITDATVPDAPTGLTATAVSPTQIDLFWLAPAYDGGAPVTGYRIEASENGTAWTDLRTNTQSRATAFQHTGLLPGSTRHYRVSAINRVGAGAASDTASAATDDPIGRAGRLNTRVLPHVASAMTSSTVSAIARRVDAVAGGTGMERRVETNGLSSMAASLSAPDAGGLGPAQGGRAGLAALFGGTSFTMPLGGSDAQQQSATGTQLASWGAGEYHHLGEPGQSALDWKGGMVSAHAGIDARVGTDLLAGVAGSYSSGSFDFTDRTGARPVRGTYGATMASVHPYMAWFSGGGVASVWGSAGLGSGDVEVDDEREGFRTAPASLLTGAGGASYRLLTRGAGGVRVRAEGWYGAVTVDGTGQIEAVTLEMQRGKLALELTQGFRAAAGQEMAVLLEGGMRYDNGDGVTGASAEVGGGLRYTNPGLGVTAEGRGRFVISARAGYEEWGIGGTLMFDPATRGQGLQVRLAPSYGDHMSGVNRLWERGVADAVGGHGPGMGPDVDGEVAYGIAGFHGTPYGGFHLGRSGTRAFSSGVRYELGSGVGLRLEGTRRESGLGAPQHTVGVRGRLRFR
ncbi:MAG: fibronectin type III domain-containing protein [Gammaproteobacteria bacterium]|nr:fibronectin type III domain-containing protein [Gammaproteobacteria bacterium]